MLTLFRSRQFALLWTAGIVSLAGDWVMRAALPYFVYQQTGSTIATAGMIVAELAPAVLLGPAAGVFVDRWDRKRLLVATNLFQALAVAALLLVSSDARLWLVYAVAAAQSLAMAFAEPAEAALLPAIVREEQLLAANSLAAFNNRLARLVGVPLGGVLLEVFGLHSVVLIDVASFLVAAALLAPIAAPRAVIAAGDATSALGRFFDELADGVRLVRRESAIATLFAVLAIMTFGGTMLDPLQAPWVHDVLEQGAALYGWLLAVHAAFGIIGSLAVGHFGANLSPRHLIGWSSLLAGVLLAVKYNVPSVPLALMLTAAGGVVSVVSAIGVQTLIQQSVRDEYRGRVFGALGASGALFSLLGASIGGVAAEWVGIVPMLDVAAALVAAAGVVVLVAYRRD